MDYPAGNPAGQFLCISDKRNAQYSMGSFSTKETEMKEESPMQAYESLFSEYPDVLTVHQVVNANIKVSHLAGFRS